MSSRELHRTTEPDLDGRTVRRRQSSPEALSETYRDKSSDLANLGLDPATRHTSHVASDSACIELTTVNFMGVSLSGCLPCIATLFTVLC